MADPKQREDPSVNCHFWGGGRIFGTEVKLCEKVLKVSELMLFLL